ncbi:hypothetical protein OG871_03430 [Kitasatospora sp. NBC_00374]|uniref:hypothetical protein n=1 Tax=Kitasatospora sp. NBC_00374 TaxID=2975964 RepID=UPI0032503FDA
MDFDTVADELYALPPAEFTAARDTAAGLARKQGDRELAARVRKLRRPTGGAWLANLLVRSHPEEIGPLLELGRALRAAQSDHAGARLRELSSRRHHLVTALTARARRTATEAGHSPGEPALRELEQTLRSVLADGDAAESFAAGHLATALDATAPLPEPVPALEPTPAPAVPEPEPAAATEPRRTAPRAAQAAVRTAEREAAQAADALELRTAEHRSAAARVRRSARRLADAEQAHREAERAEAECATALAAAERRAAQTRAEADRLRRRT